MKRRSGPRIAVTGAILTLVAAVVGFIATLSLNTFVLDDYDAYGELSIPGSTSLHLPAGEVTVSFHTAVTGSPSSGFPIPDPKFNVTPPIGIPKRGDRKHRRHNDSQQRYACAGVGDADCPEAPRHRNRRRGQRLHQPAAPFGHGSSYGWLTWVFGGLLALGVVELVVALMWSARSAKAARPLAPEELMSFDEPTGDPPPLQTVPSYTPSDQGVRLEQLKQLAALRDSGTLTDEEFDAEKRRILES
jgi:hypothetical protein